MKIISVRQKNRRTTNCIVSIIDNENISSEMELSMDLVLKERLSNDMEISDALYIRLIAVQRIIDAKQTAFNYISYRKRSQKQVVDKLKQKDFSEDEIAVTLNYLQSNDLLDDEVFAQSFVKDILLTKKIGKNKAFDQLYAKGVSREIIVKVLDEYFPNNTLEMAIIVAERKYKLLTGNPIKKPIEKIKQSLFNHLVSKGFSFEEIKQAIDKVLFN